MEQSAFTQPLTQPVPPEEDLPPVPPPIPPVIPLSPPKQPPGASLRKIIGIGAIAGVAAVLLLMGYFGYGSWAKPANELIVDNQRAIRSVRVREVKNLKTGFVIIKEKNKLGKPGDVIAQTELMAPDTYADVQIDLFVDEGGNPRHTLVRSEQLFAVLVESNSSQETASLGKVATGRNGKPLIVPFSVQ